MYVRFLHQNLIVGDALFLVVQEDFLHQNNACYNYADALYYYAGSFYALSHVHGYLTCMHSEMSVFFRFTLDHQELLYTKIKMLCRSYKWECWWQCWEPGTQLPQDRKSNWDNNRSDPAVPS